MRVFAGAAAPAEIAALDAAPAHAAVTASWSGRDAWGGARETVAVPVGSRVFHLSPAVAVPPSGDRLALLLDLIAAEEGPMGYDAVQHQATVPPPKPPTQMTVAEVFAWIGDTPGQQHAIGRYQIIPATLVRLVDVLGVPHGARFDPALQDRMGAYLARQAGYDAFASGEMEAEVFMDRLAGVWAALPDRSGKSVYHGIAGNRATLSRAEYRRRMAALFPDLVRL